ncbi:MAG: hypothetical protein HY318_17995, partial [Armatimonadetes bacterium]|nr:hypothetical protein [Armatimonadota bacterium]
ERAGKPFEERYPVFFPGSYGYGDNVQQDMTTPLIRSTRPQKHQELMRPAKIERTRGHRLKVFILKGLNADQYQLEEALTLLGAEVSIGAYSIGQEGPRTTDFPFDYEALMSCDTIVVANANVQCLGKLGLEMLGDYATHGGNLLFLGGKSAYGSGGLAEAGLAGLLPVVIRTSLFDIIRPGTRAATRDEAVLRLSDSQLAFQGLNMKSLPTCRYLHDANIAPGAKILVTAGNKPFLVAKENDGGGRVACLLGTTYGPFLERETRPPFQKWSGWTDFMSRLLKWLARGSTA